jgi:DNA-binding transcriptional ArsR family regulator/energy-coupling factor transporter ATP-binding protein EcfA2
MVMARERVEPTKEAGKPVAVELPSEVNESRFVATAEFDYDKGAFAVTIKDSEQPGREATVVFRLVRTGLVGVLVHTSVYSNGRVVLEGRGSKIGKILKAVRRGLKTKAIRSDGPIADYIRHVYRLVIEEARKVRDDLKKEARRKRIEELRNHPELLENPLRFIVTDVLGRAHYGDEIAKKTAFLSLGTAWLPDENHTHCAIVGPSSSGKSNLLKALYKCTPKPRVLGGVLRVSSSPKALFYMGRTEEAGERVRYVLEADHQVLFYVEPTMFYDKPEGGLARELFKLLLSDSEEEEICHDSVDPDRHVYRQYCIKHRPVVLTTIPDEYLTRLGGQEFARLLIVNVDLNPEVESEVLRFIRNMSKYKEEFEKRAVLVKHFLTLMPFVRTVEISEDADQYLHDLLMRDYLGDRRVTRHIRRAERDVINLAAAYELLNYTARMIKEGKEPPRELEKLVVGVEAVKYVWDLLRDAFEAKAFGNPLVKSESSVYRLISERKRPVKVAEILEATKMPKSTVYRILRELLDEGLIVQCGRGLYAQPGRCGRSIMEYTSEEQGEDQDTQQGGGDEGGSS